MLTTRKTGKRNTQVTEQTKKIILQSAADLFAEKGFENTSIREIAVNAGLTHGIIRHHFGSKLNIWQTIATDTIRQYSVNMTSILGEADSMKLSPIEAIKMLTSNFIDITFENPNLIRIMTHECSSNNERSEFLVSQIQPLHKLVTQTFERAKEQSEQLKIYDINSHFLTLFSLTAFPIMVPCLIEFLDHDNRQTQGVEAKKIHILKVLFA